MSVFSRLARFETAKPLVKSPADVSTVYPSLPGGTNLRCAQGLQPRKVCGRRRALTRVAGGVGRDCDRLPKALV